MRTLGRRARALITVQVCFGALPFGVCALSYAQERTEEVAPGATASSGVRGKIIDGATGEGLPAATLEVVGGSVQTVAELDGSFRLHLLPGRYVLRVSTPFYDPVDVEADIQAGTFVTLEATLQPTATSEDEVIEVESRLDTRSESAALAARRAAQVVWDSISGQEIARTPDSSAGDAVKRVVSVSVSDGRYVALRGLEGRYVNTLLNGVVLPSPEPDRNAVPLDLFPTSLLSNLVVIKSYSAEYPGQFAGGTLLLETNSYPTEWEAKLTASVSGGTTTTLGAGLGNHAGGGSFWGFSSAKRGLPEAVPIDYPVRNLPDQETELIGEQFENIWETHPSTPMPNVGFGATLGNSHKLGSRRLGYLGTISLRRGTLTRLTEVRTQTISETAPPELADDYQNRLTEVEATIGGLANVGLSLSDNHSLEAFGLYTHVGEDASAHINGFRDSSNANIDRTRLQFVERELLFAQLLGKHRFTGAPGLEVKWQGNAASTRRDELDSRDVAYELTEAGRFFVNQPGSGQRFFSLLADRALGAGTDASYVRQGLRLRTGFSFQDAARDLTSRRFRFVFRGTDNGVRSMAPEDMFGADHVGPSFRLAEETMQEDSYRASQSVLAGYVAAEQELAPQLRTISGLRIERARQALDNGSQFAVAGMVSALDRTNLDLIPSFNLVLSPSSSHNLRGAYSYALVRPRFRELAPFLFFDYVRGRSVSGNPNLVDTHIHNVDARWEWYPTSDSVEAEVVAVSAFFKRFGAPIEQVLVNTATDARFENALAGQMSGLELEGRVSLARAHKALRGLRVGGNLALISSKVELGSTSPSIQTSLDRPMYGQSPYVANLSVSLARPWLGEVTALYNVVGRRIADVGTQGLPDTYEQPFHRFDVTFSRVIAGDVRFKASLANLLNQDVRLVQGELVISRYLPGVSASLGFEWAPEGGD